MFQPLRQMFESSVNSYGRQTLSVKIYTQQTVLPQGSSTSMFESSVNSYGRQTVILTKKIKCLFESSVNSYGRQTMIGCVIS